MKTAGAVLHPHRLLAVIGNCGSEVAVENCDGNYERETININELKK